LLDPSPAESQAPRVASVFTRVRELLRAPTPLAAVARHAGYDPDHLTRKLKREGGLGLRALRDRLRLESAQAALRTSVTVAEAAVQSGFEDPNYFTRWFRRQTGQTPSEFRG
jgi:AraC-like DNA-binding protein